MKDCGDYSANILLYLDNELSLPGREEFLAHLRECDVCRNKLAAEEELSTLLRGSRPLYSASRALRSRVMDTVAKPRSATRPAPIRFCRRMVRLLALPPSVSTTYCGTLAAVVLFVAAGPLLLPRLQQRSLAAAYAEAAVAAHRSLLEGRLPLEVRTDSPSAVTAWFTGKVPFVFRLPNSVESPRNEPVYRLLGASLVNYQGGDAALVAYQMQQQVISLLVASSKSAVVAGGEEVPSGGIVFHYRKQDNLNVITWSNHYLSYALVSSLAGPGRQSCMVCHQSMADGGQLSGVR